VARVDYDDQSEVYDRARGLTPEAITTWMATARIHLRAEVTRLLDLGSGTGRFSAPLADTFDCDVIGVEPSAGMLAQAATKPHPRVHLLRSPAEHLPLDTATFGGAWLSNVLHHFDDMPAAASELRRVVVPGGPVMIRGAFAGRGPISTLYRFFPGAEATIESFPSIPDVIDAFEAAGFGSFSLEKVDQLIARSLTEMVERIRLRADTTLELLGDEEFEAGLEAMVEETKTNDGPVLDALDLLVLR
jgi:ubiquinone/menaquinone biosynthesis C-methylase UbiE